MKLIYVSRHAIERYRERIENVAPLEVIARLRAGVTPHRTLPPGVWNLEMAKKGPGARVKLIVDERAVNVVTVHPLTDAQEVRGMQKGNWDGRERAQVPT